MAVFEFRQWIESIVSVQQMAISILVAWLVAYFTIRYMNSR